MLEKQKYYIGKTSNPQFRIESHFNSFGSAWTKKYKPLKIIEIKSNCDIYDEDKITLQYMHKYGINNVCGGSFISVKLDNSEIEIIKSSTVRDRYFKNRVLALPLFQHLPQLHGHYCRNEADNSNSPNNRCA